MLIASRVAPLTRHIGLMPTAVVTHTEPFHLSKAIATLDYVSSGRAGIRVQVSASPEAARHFGRARRHPTPAARLLAEAADYVEVLRRLWDSWEDDAEIRDVATGRFVDRDKLHYIDFDGAWFSVKGPSITPRPPQGQPIVAALGPRRSRLPPDRGAAPTSGSSPRTTPREITAIVDAIASRRAAGLPPVRVFADLVVFLDDTADAAPRRDGSGSTIAPGANTPATQRSSSARRRSWPTCCRSGTRRARPDSGCDRPRSRTTCTRSPTGWCPSCSVAECSATPTAPPPCGARSACPRPANRYADRLTS